MFEQLNKFLLDSKNYCVQTNNKQSNFFEIAGFPHYENVVSNILAFLLDTREEHNCSELWLKSLIECSDKIDIENGELNVLNINREYCTNSNKKIDIVIELENHIIVIENKIYASLYNPFADYYNAIKDNNKNFVGILLSIKKENDVIGDEYRFLNITYQNLIDKVLMHIGEYLGNISEKWLVFMKEFINNLLTFYNGDEIKMDKNWQNFIKDKEKELKIFLDNYYNDINQKMHFRDQVLEKINNLNQKNFEIGKYNGGKMLGYFSLWINIKNDKGDTMALEPYIMRDNPCYMTCALWNRSNTKSYSFDKEFDLLRKQYPSIEYVSREEGGAWGKFLKIKIFDFSNDDSMNINLVAEEINSIAESIFELYSK